MPPCRLSWKPTTPVRLRLAILEGRRPRIAALRYPAREWPPLRILDRAFRGLRLLHAGGMAVIFADARHNTEPTHFARAAQGLPVPLRRPNSESPRPLVDKPSAQGPAVRLGVCSGRHQSVLLPTP